jgi:hypothetical protein
MLIFEIVNINYVIYLMNVFWCEQTYISLTHIDGVIFLKVVLIK